MGHDSQNIRELIDFCIAIIAWVVSICIVYMLLKAFILPQIPS